MVLKKIAAGLMLCSVLAGAGVAHASVVEVRGKADVPFQTGFFASGADAAVRQKAIEQAKIGAWKRYTATFNPARLQSYKLVESEILANLDEYVIDLSVIDEGLNKEAQLFSVSIRASINEAALSARLNSSGGEVQQSSAAVGAPFTFMFVAREVESVKSFDTRRTDMSVDESELSANQSGAMRGGSASLEESKKEVRKTTTGGSSLRKANEVKYRVRSGADVDAAMTEVLAGYGFDVVGYADVVANCGGAAPAAIEKEFSESDEMSVDSRKRVIDAARACEAGYFAVGTLDVGIHDVDPVTGNQRVHVSVRGHVWDITAKLPRRVASVGPIQFAGLGPDPDVAARNALRLSAEQSARMIIDQLNAKGLR